MNKKYKKAHNSHPIYPQKDNIKTLALAALHLTLLSLWPHIPYDAFSADPIHKVIMRILLSAADPYVAYSQYCQRVLLYAEKAGDQVCPYDGTAAFIQQPAFEAAVLCFTAIETRRRVEPLYRQNLKALPEAILEMVEMPAFSIFAYWLRWLGLHNDPSACRLLKLFRDRSLQIQQP